MLIDDLKEQLKNTESDIETITAYWKNAGLEKKFNELDAQANTDNFWQNPDQASILKELQRIRIQREQYLYIYKAKKELEELIHLFGTNDNELNSLKADIDNLLKTIHSFKISLLLNEPQDESDCFVSINAGAGGTEAQDWANILLRMYTRFCERNKFAIHVIDYQPAEEAGIKSADLYIKGKNAYGLLKSEHGVHRLVRISPFDASKRRHTSFASVTLTPEVPEIAVTIDPNDLRIDTYRAGGAGGQHVNKTDSAVRITHIPTGLVTQCQSERSQTQNKVHAMKMLKAKLFQKLKEERESTLSAGIEKKKIEWGSQIRSYVLHPYKMVKDHRTNLESPQPDLVLDGELMDFIEHFLVWRTKNT
jgi:peptide chain release factor 2